MGMKIEVAFNIEKARTLAEEAMMAKVTRFEDLVAWQKARVLAQSISALLQGDSFSRDFALKDQMRRSSISIPANIAEGFERDGNKEFIKFLSIAKGSAGELRSHLILALDQGYLSNSEYEPVEFLLLETSRLIGGLMNYLKRTEKKGRKFKE